MFCVFSNFDGKYVPILFQYIFSGKHRVRSLSPIYVQTCQFWLMWLPSHCRPKGLQSAPPLLALQVFRVQGAPCGSWCGGWRNREMGTIPWVSTHPKAQNHRGTLKDMNVLSDSISHFYMSRIWIYFWVNCNISLTWIVRPWLGIISHIKTMIPGFGRTVRSWWNLPRYMCIYIYYISNAIIVPFYSHHIPLNPYLPRYLDLYSTLRCHQLHGWKIHHGSTWGISQCQAQMWLGGFPGFPMSPWRLEVPTIYDNCLVVEPPMVDIMVNIWLI